jgi:hypothetical protein
MKTKLLIPIVVALMLTSISLAADSDLQARRDYLEQVKSWLPPDRAGRGEVSPLDKTWTDWLNRTAELPPDFDKMPSIPFLPDPLILDEAGQNIPVKTPEQWQQKRQWIAEQVKHWITGTFPPPPDNLEAKILSEQKDGEVTLRTVELRFGPPVVSGPVLSTVEGVDPEQQAKMTAELIIPPCPSTPPFILVNRLLNGFENCLRPF